MTSVTVVDSGVVNLRNITRALEHVGGHVRIDKDPSSVLQADSVSLKNARWILINAYMTADML